MQLVPSEKESPKKLPYVGTDDYSKLASVDSLLVDKSLFLKEFFESKDESTLFTRMRRKGKTSLLSMANCFFSSHPENIAKSKDLFSNTLIAKDNEFCTKHQRQYPVIFITLKNITFSKYEETVEGLKNLIKTTFINYRYLLESDILFQEEKVELSKYMSGEMNIAELAVSLNRLSYFLSKHHKKKTLILIDEYDAPFNRIFSMLVEAQDSSSRDQIRSYFNALTLLFKNFFGAALKSNENLEKGLMTGILRISKNEMLSELNNLNCYGVLDKKYAQFFGFTETEVRQLLREANIDEQKIEEIKEWYNGYNIGDELLYNPWSVMCYIRDIEENSKRGCPKAYWVKTGGLPNAIRKLLFNDDSQIKAKMRALIAQKGEIPVQVSESIVFDDLFGHDQLKREMSLWSVLLCSGYLTATHVFDDGEIYACHVRIPNHEVRISMSGIFSSWLDEQLGSHCLQPVLACLCEGDVEKFSKEFGRYILTSTSLRDFQAESDYQALFIGLLYTLNARYEIKSNIEMGFGYPDFTLVPRSQFEQTDLGIVLELKHLSASKKPKKLFERKECLVELAKTDALEQIDEKQYSELFVGCPHVKRVLKIGISFSGKMMVCAFRMNKVTDLCAKTDISICYGFDESNLVELPQKKKKLKRSDNDDEFVGMQIDDENEDQDDQEEDDDEVFQSTNSSQKYKKVSPAQSAGKHGVFKKSSDNFDDEADEFVPTYHE